MEAEGIRCPKNGQEMCVKCTKAGYALSGSYKCVPQCSCKNGRAFDIGAAECKKPGDKICKSCFMGYELDKSDKLCKPACYCPHGAAAKLGTCTKPKELNCKKDGCAPGFEYSDKHSKKTCVGDDLNPNFPKNLPKWMLTMKRAWPPDGRGKCLCVGTETGR